MTFAQYLISTGTGIEIIGVLMIAWPSVRSSFSKLFDQAFQTLPGQVRVGLRKRNLMAKIGVRASMDARHKLAPNPSTDRVVEWATAEIDRAEQRLIARMDDAIARVESNTRSELQKYRDLIDTEMSQLSSRIGGVAKYPNVRGWGVGVAIFGLGLVSVGSFMSAGG